MRVSIDYSFNLKALLRAMIATPSLGDTPYRRLRRLNGLRAETRRPCAARRWWIGLALAGAIFLGVSPSAAAQNAISFEGAVRAARDLAASGETLQAAELVRTALVYETDIRHRRFAFGDAEREIARWFLAFVDGGPADRLVPGTPGGAQTGKHRELVAAILGKGKPAAGLGATTLQPNEVCDLLAVLSLLRPGETRAYLNAALPAASDLSADLRSCLVHAVVYNLQIKVDDTGLYADLFTAPKPEAVEDLILALVGGGRYAEAMALTVHMRDAGLRQRVENAVIASRQLGSLGLSAAELERATWAIVRQREGRERKLFGGLLAMQASPKFWVENAGSIGALLASSPDDADLKELSSIWARHVLVKAKLDGAELVWARVPILIPDPAFLISYLYLSDDPRASAPTDAELKLLPGRGLRHAARAIAVVRSAQRGPREAAGSLRLLLDDVSPGPGAALAGLDALLIAASARHVEKAARGEHR
jgi:hypothetical protein